MIDPQDLDERLLRLLAARLRVEAARLELAASVSRATRALEGFARAFEATQAPFEAERAVAHFEGRTPPSAEVFEHQTARDESA